MKKYICIDIGGTAVKYGVIDENENFLIKKRHLQKQVNEKVRVSWNVLKN